MGGAWRTRSFLLTRKPTEFPGVFKIIKLVELEVLDRRKWTGAFASKNMG